MTRSKKTSLPNRSNGSGKGAIQTWGPFIGILAAVMGICLHIKWPELLKAKPLEHTSVNLSLQPYVYDFKDAFALRDENMKKYDFQYDEVGIDRRSGLSLEEFWDIYDGKW